MRKSHLEFYMSQAESLGLLSFEGLAMDERVDLFMAHLREVVRVVAAAAGRPVRAGAGDFWLRSTVDARANGPGMVSAIEIPQEAHDLLTVLGFDASGRKIFKLAEDFGRELARANLDLPVSVIPRREETILVEFPDWAAGAFENEDGTYAVSCYIRQEMVPLLDGSPGRLLRLQFPDYDCGGAPAGTSSYLNIRLDGGKEIDSLIAAAEEMGGRRVPICKEAIRYAVASYVYVSSGDPDLRHLRPRPLPSSKKAKKFRQFARESAGESLLDLTLVGYDFKKAKVFSIDETTVRGHLRLQPCGEGRTQVRVIWIDPHVRRFQKDEAGADFLGIPASES